MTTKDIDIDTEKTVEENGYEENENIEELSDEAVQPRRKKHTIAKKLFVVIALCFCAYAAFTIIYDKAEISKLRNETEEINKQIDEQKALNDEYSRMLDSGEKEYMKKIAIDKLGYAYPE